MFLTHGKLWPLTHKSEKWRIVYFWQWKSWHQLFFIRHFIFNLGAPIYVLDRRASPVMRPIMTSALRMNVVSPPSNGKCDQQRTDYFYFPPTFARLVSPRYGQEGEVMIADQLLWRAAVMALSGAGNFINFVPLQVHRFIKVFARFCVYLFYCVLLMRFYN